MKAPLYTNEHTPATIEEFRQLILRSIIHYRNAALTEHQTANIRSNQLWTDYNRASSPMSSLHAKLSLFAEALEQLEAEGLLEMRGYNAYRFEKIRVSAQQAEKISQMTGLILRRKAYEELTKELDTYANTSCTQLREQIHENAAAFLRKYFKYTDGTADELQTKKQELHTLCKCVEAVFSNAEDIEEKNFSARLLEQEGIDFDAYRENVARILRASATRAKPNVPQILKRYHILQDPAYVTVRGCGRIYMKNGDRITCNNGAVTLETEHVRQIDRIITSKVMTAEDMVAFRGMPGDNGLVVYTEEIPSLLVQEFLDKIHH